MEVWALYAYGAANVLQEMMTIKSDDVVGRVKVYESLVKGTPIAKSGIPESFRVLIKEFQALGLDITVLDENGNYQELKDLEEDEQDSYLSTDEFETNIDASLNEEPELPSEELDEELDDYEEEFEDVLEETDDDFEDSEDMMEGDEE